MSNANLSTLSFFTTFATKKIALSKTNSISAFENVYKTYYIRMYHYAYGFINDMDASKDVVSDVFSKLWKDFSDIDLDKVSSYLYVCVRNESMNYLRKQKGMAKYVEYCKSAFSEEDENYWQNMDDRLTEIGTIIDTMPSKTKFVLEQCYMNGHTYKEVAEMMDITTNGAKKHITKAFSLLRSHFKDKKEGT